MNNFIIIIIINNSILVLLFYLLKIQRTSPMDPNDSWKGKPTTWGKCEVNWVPRLQFHKRGQRNDPQFIIIFFYAQKIDLQIFTRNCPSVKKIAKLVIFCEIL